MVALRILLVAPNDGHSNLYLRRALVAQGHVVEEFDYRAYWQALAGVSTPTAALVEMNTHFERRVRARQHGEAGFGLVVVLKGELLSPTVLRGLREDGYMVALWHFDPWQGREGWVVERARACSFFFTIAEGLVPWYESKGVRAHWLLEAADPELHAPCHGNREVDVSFIGTVDGVPGRREWLESLAVEFPGMVQVWGSFTGEVEGVRVHGRAEGDMGFRQVVAATRVNLGRDRHPEIRRSYGARLFRTLAAGGFLLTNTTEGILTDFNGAVGTYEDESCRRAVAYWLEEVEERGLVAQRGRQLVLRRHTWRHRVESLMESVERDEGVA